MSCRLGVLLSMALVLAPALGVAQVPDSSSAPAWPAMDAGSVGSMILRLVLTLAGVVALILATVWVLKRATARRWPGKTQSRPIQVLERVHLAPKRSLDVVAVGERVLLLGVTEHAITLLTELSPQERGQLGSAGTQPTAFTGVLGEARERMRHVFAQAHAELPRAAAVSAGVACRERS